MIIGRGLIASLFVDEDKDEVIFFASGVSNSLETKVEEFCREENLILSTIAKYPEKLFVYFSTCSIYDSSKVESQYVLHKLKMERLIAEHAKQYLILRVSNAVGNGGNPNLLMNYLIRAAKSGEIINAHTKATRNLIDTEDIKNITLNLIDKKLHNKIINLAYLHNYSIIEILGIIEEYFSINLTINLIHAGSGYDIAIQDIREYFEKKKLTNKEEYLKRILKNYYNS